MDHLLSITKIFRLLQWRCLRPATSYLKLVLMIYLFGKRIDITLVEIQNFKYREKNQHCVKSVQIRSYFCISCIWSEYRKIRTRKNSVFGHFSRSENRSFKIELSKEFYAWSFKVYENCRFKFFEFFGIQFLFLIWAQLFCEA